MLGIPIAQSRAEMTCPERAEGRWTRKETVWMSSSRTFPKYGVVNGPRLFKFVERKISREQLFDLSIARDAKARLDREPPFKK
jgi:hypothetical protein